MTGWSGDDVLLLPGRRVRQRAAARATRSPWCTTPTTSTTSRWRRSRAGPTSRRRRSCCRRPTAGGADYRLRIFTPDQELPFAGHPTLGSAHAWLERGGRPRYAGDRLVQECGAGLVEVRRDGERLGVPGAALPAGGTGRRRPGRAGARLPRFRRRRSTSSPPAGSTTARAGWACSWTVPQRGAGARPEVRRPRGGHRRDRAAHRPRTPSRTGAGYEVRAFCPGRRSARTRSPAA